MAQQVTVTDESMALQQNGSTGQGGPYISLAGDTGFGACLSLMNAALG